jgi:replicative DNA helicase
MTEPAPRQLPHNVEAEQALLGAIMLHNETFEHVSNFLDPEHFSEEIHRQIYDVMGGLIRDGKVATPVTLRSYLGDQNLGGGMTIPRYLARLASEATGISNARDYARTVVDLASRRRIISIAMDMSEAAYSGAIDMAPSELAAESVEALDSIVTKAFTHAPRVSIARAASEAVSKAEETARRGIVAGVETGLIDLDGRLGGMQPGDFIICAGRPGMGKSALGMTIAYNVAMKGTGVAFFSHEMTAEQFGQRALSSVTFEQGGGPIEYRSIRKAKDLTTQQFQRLRVSVAALENVPLMIEQQPRLGLSQIASRSRRMAKIMAAKGTPLGLIIIDHIGLVAPPTRYKDSREREVADISKGMKELAKEMGVPIMALAQLSRRVDERPLKDRRPQLSDLRESGSLEQDADIVLGLFREAYYLAEKRDIKEEEARRLNECANELEIITLKNRMGGGGTTIVACFIGSNLITNRAVDTQEPLSF